MEEKVKELIADVFGISPNEITYESSPDTVSNWDSLSHINLIIALEEELNIHFTEDEILEMATFERIIMTLRKHGINI